MKITKEQLRQIIKEELSAVLNEYGEFDNTSASKEATMAIATDYIGFFNPKNTARTPSSASLHNYSKDRNMEGFTSKIAQAIQQDVERGGDPMQLVNDLMDSIKATIASQNSKAPRGSQTEKILDDAFSGLMDLEDAIKAKMQ